MKTSFLHEFWHPERKYIDFKTKLGSSGDLDTFKLYMKQETSQIALQSNQRRLFIQDDFLDTVTDGKVSSFEKC